MLLSVWNLSAIFEYSQCMSNLFLCGYWVSVKLTLVKVVVKVKDLLIRVSRLLDI